MTALIVLAAVVFVGTFSFGVGRGKSDKVYSRNETDIYSGVTKGEGQEINAVVTDLSLSPQKDLCAVFLESETGSPHFSIMPSKECQLFQKGSKVKVRLWTETQVKVTKIELQK